METDSPNKSDIHCRIPSQGAISGITQETQRRHIFCSREWNETSLSFPHALAMSFSLPLLFLFAGFKSPLLPLYVRVCSFSRSPQMK